VACLIAIVLPKCESNCDLDAAFEVIGRKGEKRGRYCEKHAKARLLKVHAEENHAPSEGTK
jgi:hypothetical protein